MRVHQKGCKARTGRGSPTSPIHCREAMGLCLNPCFQPTPTGEFWDWWPTCFEWIFLFLPLPLLPLTDSSTFYSFYISCCLDGDKNIIHWARALQNQDTRGIRTRKKHIFMVCYLFSVSLWHLGMSLGWRGQGAYLLYISILVTYYCFGDL